MHYGEELVFPVILKYHINESLFKEMNILEFKEENIKWAQFIVNNRNGFEYMKDVNSCFHNLKQKFDIVIGSIADNQISLLTKELKALKEKVTDNDLRNMRYSYHTNQVSFHTQRSLTCLELFECDIITKNKQKGEAVNE